MILSRHARQYWIQQQAARVQNCKHLNNQANSVTEPHPISYANAPSDADAPFNSRWAEKIVSFYDYACSLRSKLSVGNELEYLTRVNLLSGAAALRAWVFSQVSPSFAISSISQVHLIPVGASESALIDSSLTISIARTYGLKSSSGARGDATSYVKIDCLPRPIAVIKVIKNEAVFADELAAFNLLTTILPSPQHFHTPQLLAAAFATIPALHSTDRSVAPLSSLLLPSSSPCGTHEGGLILMSIANGVPITSLFSPQHPFHADLTLVLTKSAQALAELHSTSTPSIEATVDTLISGQIFNTRASRSAEYIKQFSLQIIDMIQKLQAPSYSTILDKYQINLTTIQLTLDRLTNTFLSLLKSSSSRLSASFCYTHGDAHAGNVIWDHSSDSLTFVDIPTLLESVALIGISSSTNINSMPATSTTQVPIDSTNVGLFSISYSARDTSHFRQKLLSQGRMNGLTMEKLKECEQLFRKEYDRQREEGKKTANSMIGEKFAGRMASQEDREEIEREKERMIGTVSELFFSFRCVMGELTQLVKYAPESIDLTLIEKLGDLVQATMHFDIS